ncbi:hypothetical protein [Enterobacter cloacae]|uniref:hypothetical protein n=1 Tax=Enterobacter cloacae TaxID=550 RepID=UPI00312C6ECC
MLISESAWEEMTCLFAPSLNAIVRYHHTHWNNGRGACVNGIKTPKESHIIYLADRLDVLISHYRASDIITAQEEIIKIIVSGENDLFQPDYIHADLDPPSPNSFCILS